VRGFLLDTNVVSELRRPAPEQSVRAFVAAQLKDTLFVSEVTFAKIRFGTERQGDPGRRRSPRMSCSDGAC
jgi:predicted nucleic acid-binding protein